MGEETEDEDETKGPGDNAQDLSEAVDRLTLEESITALPAVAPANEESLQWAGFNGRCNKYADTCYSFWNTGTLEVRAADSYHEVFQLTQLADA